MFIKWRVGTPAPTQMCIKKKFSIFSIAGLLILANILVHISDIKIFGFDMNNIPSNCLHTTPIFDAFVLNQNVAKFNRLLLSGFIHKDILHLSISMCSFWFKGLILENMLGSTLFLKAVMFSLLFSHVLYVLTSGILDVNTDVCIVGFSSVLFAMQYMIYHCNNDSLSVPGVTLTIPYKYVAFLETAVVYFMCPEMSPLIYCSSVLSGMAFVYLFIPASITAPKLTVGNSATVAKAHRLARKRSKIDLIRSPEMNKCGPLQPISSHCSMNSMCSVESTVSRYEDDIARDFDDGNDNDIDHCHNVVGLTGSTSAEFDFSHVQDRSFNSEERRIRDQRADKLSKFSHDTDNFASSKVYHRSV